MIDEKKAAGYGERSSILPPKIFEQGGVDLFSAPAKIRESMPQESYRPEPAKRSLNVSTLVWLLMVILVVVLALFFFAQPIDKWLSKSVSGPAEMESGASSTPVLPMKPSVSVPVPTDEEIDAAPIPQAANDLLPSLT